MLKLTGATLAFVAGAGVASADHEHPDVDTGYAFWHSDGTADLSGSLIAFGQGASSADVWFQWRDAYDSTFNETSKQTVTSTGSFSDTIYGLQEYHKYEYRAVARDGDDGDVGYGDTITFTYKTRR